MYQVCEALGLDAKTVFKAGRKAGYEINAARRIPPEVLRDILSRLIVSDGISPEEVGKLQLQSFVELRDLILRRLRLAKEDGRLTTDDKNTLLEYIHILQSKIHRVGLRYEIDFNRKILVRIEENEAIPESPIMGAVKKLNWKLLPPGTNSFEQIVRHFESLARRESHVVYDLGRLHKVHSFHPDDVYVGIEEFDGYVVFYFSESSIAVLECPITGNATYVFGDNWKALSHLSKHDLLNSGRRDFVRIVHTDEWFSRLRLSLLQI
jgi:hypothetical protein